MVRYTDLESMIEDGIIEKGWNRPKCVTLMKQKFVEYVVGKSITHVYPVAEEYSNQAGGMQGGLISAAFDNTFGVLVWAITNRQEMATLDLNVSFHKPIYLNDKLIITAYIKSRGKTLIHLLGEAYDSKKNLIATANSNYYLFKKIN